MKFGLYVPNFGAYGDPHNLLELALAAEHAGWDGMFLWDHVLLHRHSDIPMVDAWVALAAIAARTTRLRVGPMVTPLARRRPWKVAREITSLDTLSKGRAVLGVGLGAPADAEFECFGEDPADRVRAEKMDEALTIVAALQSGEPTSFAGAHFTVSDVRFVPPPVQRPHVPIWLAGFHPNVRPLRRAAQWQGVFPLRPPSTGAAHVDAAEVLWSTMWLSPAQLGECVDIVRRYRPSLDGFDVIASGGTRSDDRAAAKAHVEQFRAVGATWWLEWLDEQRASYPAMLEHIRRGPPK
ncbi:MAG: LLM class flavin-dependent oxidoreductase [Novosphingobium sp.]|nr:LLM class flavin-dependent oxidoreductase [Novosphingobium sp.]